jgi:hypothetical protein
LRFEKLDGAIPMCWVTATQLATHVQIRRRGTRDALDRR